MPRRTRASQQAEVHPFSAWLAEQCDNWAAKTGWKSVSEDSSRASAFAKFLGVDEALVVDWLTGRKVEVRYEHASRVASVLADFTGSCSVYHEVVDALKLKYDPAMRVNRKRDGLVRVLEFNDLWSQLDKEGRYFTTGVVDFFYLGRGYEKSSEDKAEEMTTYLAPGEDNVCVVPDEIVDIMFALFHLGSVWEYVSRDDREECFYRFADLRYFVFQKARMAFNKARQELHGAAGLSEAQNIEEAA